MSDEIQRALGRIEGELKGMKETQHTHGQQLNAINKRVTGNEIKAARNGAVSGGVITVGLMLLKETFKIG